MAGNRRSCGGATGEGLGAAGDLPLELDFGDLLLELDLGDLLLDLDFDESPLDLDFDESPFDLDFGESPLDLDLLFFVFFLDAGGSCFETDGANLPFLVFRDFLVPLPLDDELFDGACGDLLFDFDDFPLPFFVFFVVAETGCGFEADLLFFIFRDFFLILPLDDVSGAVPFFLLMLILASIKVGIADEGL